MMPNGFNSNRKSTQNRAFGFDTMSTKKNNSNHHHLFQQPQKPQFQSHIPSAIKSASRIPNHRPFNDHGFGGPNKFGGFNSVQKNHGSTKLSFGMASQTRPSGSSSLYTPNRVSSAIRLSSSRKSSIASSRKSKSIDNRHLTDQNYHRECADKIIDFLNINGFPIQLNRQNILRLSLSDASKIFKFLFSFFNENIAIKNGPQTALNQVVPKQMQLLGYPYLIKNSDLTSFIGGRQLGLVLSMLDFLIDAINYLINFDFNRLLGYNSNGFWSENETNIKADMNDDDDAIYMNKVLLRIYDLVSKFDWDNHDDVERFNEENDNYFKLLAEKFYGTEEQLDKLRNDELQQKEEKLQQELSYLNELPTKLLELMDEIESLRIYIDEMSKHKQANLAIKNALADEIKSNQEDFEKLLAENRRLESIVDSQKHLVIEYQCAIERRKQSQKEIEKKEQDCHEINMEILKLTSEIKDEHSKLESFLCDIHEMLTLSCKMYENSQIHDFFPVGTKKFTQNSKWIEFMNKFQQLKSINIDENLVEKFTTLKIKENINDFHMHIIEIKTKLKSKISLDIVFENENKQKQYQQRQQEFTGKKNQFEQLWQQKNDNQFEYPIKIVDLNKEIEQLKMEIIDHEKSIETIEMDENKLKKQIQEMEEKFFEKQSHFIDEYKKRDQEFLSKESKLLAEVGEKYQTIEKPKGKMKKTLTKMKKR
ncbi:kinetochore-associated Ndc80 complex subunit ndc80 [Dermatophagoides farinae]|uniref:Kinetochore protein NDC80 n=1 Tax=Dermatophagoides farinae TaxID=6954 RepID=A0A922I8T3_DERFA|nr:kinetochore-associated Ndc80 complex subunit ndc80 [Dermatophagoides farinae]